MKYVQRIRLQNFKRFDSLDINFKEGMNILIGDNESGKSTILNAISLVLSGNRNKIETLGLESLFNRGAVEKFLKTDRKYEDLPTMYIELYLNDFGNEELNGNANSLNMACDGLKLECTPNDELSKEIKEIITTTDDNFPYEYYNVGFTTFLGDGYSGYKRYLKHVLIDNSQINSEYAIRNYVQDMYENYVVGPEKHKNQNEYRKTKQKFTKESLSEINNRLNDYQFTIKHNSKSNLNTDLTISEDDIYIENKGKGKQCFIKTEFALNKSKVYLDVVLLEEPENHLSHTRTKELISLINSSDSLQRFVSTHSNLIASRLNLKSCLLFNSNTNNVINFNDIDEETANFFMKAPEAYMLEFVLSKKSILVEGNAEYILMEKFIEKVLKQEIEETGIHIISVGGTSFKRYLEIAKHLKIKTAVIRDNDTNYQENCVDRYSNFTNNEIQVFADKDNARSTFEICMYNDNIDLCEKLFSGGRKKLNVQEYMLKNKAEVAFQILNAGDEIDKVPKYIEEAIQWINN